MAKVAFVFPGQGSQAVGMGKDLYEQFPEARAVFDAVDDALNEKLSTTCFEGPEDALKLTATTQPAILTVSAAVHAVFKTRGPAPAFVAGHSLGEYSALVAAGSLDLRDAARAVRARGTFMQEAVPADVGAMAAILGLAPDAVKAACDAAAEGEIVSPANYNSPEQTVIAGHKAAVERAGLKCKEAGAKRVMPLPVSAPFHCALMDPVKPKLAQVLAGVRVLAPQVPVVSNVEATPNSDAARVVPLLLAQVSAPVRWIECVEALKAHGVTHVVELGPGKVLGGLIKRITKDIESFNVENAATLEKVLAALGAA
ncbi:[acyl-carrier-protein] S-malonyltransferase [Corallococcus praedator]|uniref:Malonyl CoA-acyl carrier protein transacylase n=1 Tax=Corallococcus praedator TaxID=2316724 RepID=A0ABX9QLY9_9BACT|nr:MULTISPECIES: ACP S-malonyltransferase [Corallococcus]RKH16275.1 [acyl-carrier-protein] S-malonyltransferase [Corallococcus sp. CA047B]RKH31567.1 [acyl-carrier-protein] S-malonyltransferase [Corallococcus sp. CA031C]RKI10658.1 [acyl-carrier-protein] S-malonyltransferase [Corallococcus praedator]